MRDAKKGINLHFTNHYSRKVLASKNIIFLHCAVDAEAVEVEVLLDVATDDAVEVNEDDVVALFDPDPGFPVNDIISVLDKWI